MTLHILVSPANIETLCHDPAAVAAMVAKHDELKEENARLQVQIEGLNLAADQYSESRDRWMQITLKLRADLQEIRKMTKLTETLPAQLDAIIATIKEYQGQFSAIRATLGARDGESTLDAARRVVAEREGAREAKRRAAAFTYGVCVETVYNRVFGVLPIWPYALRRKVARRISNCLNVKEMPL